MNLRTIYHAWMGCVLGATITGCASTQRSTALPEPRPLGAQYTSAGNLQPNPAEDAVAIPESTGLLSRHQALRLALLYNPELAAYSHDVRAADARTLQARLMPNPTLGLEVEEYDRGGAGSDSAEGTLALAQLIELGGKRRWRARTAEAEGELAGWDYERKRLEVFSLTGQRFVAVVAAHRRLELARSLVGLAEETSRAVTERVKAGKEPRFQASKAEAEMQVARIVALEADYDLDASRRQLAAMWGSTEPRFDQVQGDLDAVLETVPGLDTLGALLPGNPDLARWDAELHLRHAILSSAISARVPNVMAAVGFQRFEEDGTDALAFGVRVPLPIFDRNQGNVAAARHGLAGAEAQRRAVDTALNAELAVAHADLTSAHSRVMTLRSNVVPAMEDTFRAAHEGYRQGKFGFLDMLDAQRSLFQSQGALIDALLSYHTAVIDIQRITATHIEELTIQNQERQR